MGGYSREKAIEDLKIPFIKNLMLEKANQDILNSEKIYLKGKITDVERFQKIIDTWSLTSESLSASSTASVFTLLPSLSTVTLSPISKISSK